MAKENEPNAAIRALHVNHIHFKRDLRFFIQELTELDKTPASNRFRDDAPLVVQDKPVAAPFRRVP